MADPPRFSAGGYSRGPPRMWRMIEDAMPKKCARLCNRRLHNPQDEGGLIDEGRRLQGGSVALVTEHPLRDGVQFGVDSGDDPLQRRLIAGPPCRQKLRDVGGTLGRRSPWRVLSKKYFETMVQISASIPPIGVRRNLGHDQESSTGSGAPPPISNEENNK